MKTYIGTKIVKAEPMEEVYFFVNVKKQELISGRDNRPGYLIQCQLPLPKGRGLNREI
jgi:hypothetical protein